MGRNRRNCNGYSPETILNHLMRRSRNYRQTSRTSLQNRMKSLSTTFWWQLYSWWPCISTARHKLHTTSSCLECLPVGGGKNAPFFFLNSRPPPYTLQAPEILFYFWLFYFGKIFLKNFWSRQGGTGWTKKKSERGLDIFFEINDFFYLLQDQAFRS